VCVDYNYKCETVWLTKIMPAQKYRTLPLSLCQSNPLCFGPCPCFGLLFDYCVFFNFARNATLYVHIRELPTCCPVIPVSSDLHSLQLLASLVVKLCRRVRGEFVGVCLSACSPVNNTALKTSKWS